MNPSLNILLSTIDQGINNVKNVVLDYREDVSYIISHQYTKEQYKLIPKELIRRDIFVSQIPGRGVTKSRNNAIRLANGRIGLFSDDDVTYTNQYFDKIIDIFSNNKNLDIALFKIKTPIGYPEYKQYPKEKINVKNLPFSVGTIEIAFIIDKIKENRLLFDERFGAGQKLLIGSDESIFVLDAIKKDLDVWYYPEYIVDHPFDSTVRLLAKYDKRKVSVVGAFDARINGFISIPKAFLGTIKYFPDLIKNKKNPFFYLKERLFASIYILRTNK